MTGFDWFKEGCGLLHKLTIAVYAAINIALILICIIPSCNDAHGLCTSKLAVLNPQSLTASHKFSLTSARLQPSRRPDFAGHYIIDLI